jgi:MoaA/NifB/PqqE/SkfB family radical SAM enzyme
MNPRVFLLRNALKAMTGLMIHNDRLRGYTFRQIDKALRQKIIDNSPEGRLSPVQRDRQDLAFALFDGIDRIMAKRLVSKKVATAILEAFMGNVILNEDCIKAEDVLGFEPPSFITISPTGACNLRCTGCYAADSALHGSKLSLEVFDRILREKRELWGSHWTVVSGGEPFMWKDKGVDLLDLAALHPQDMFMVYTNGTLIDDEQARRMADTGNVSVAFSVEGFEAETDERRGAGVHAKILAAMERLRRHGVPFGFSATATCHNWELITSEEFADFYYREQGALYGWIFQYMPIGRGPSFDLVIPPEARVKMYERMWQLVRERNVFMVDFWNSGTASKGCISAGRPTGYLYINWDGDVMPCVFTPYAAANMHEIYAEGGTLNSVLDTPFFRELRRWQEDYGFQKPMAETGNWMCPCPIRDHFDEFKRMAKAGGARPINDEAADAMTDEDYRRRMLDYGAKLEALTGETWERKYEGSPRKSPSVSEDEASVDPSRTMAKSAK